MQRAQGKLRPLFIGFLALLFMIPLNIVEGIVRERTGYQYEAVSSIGTSWAQNQTLVGPVLIVPASAIIDSGTAQVVLVARGQGRFEPRPVRIGARGDGTAQILSGLEPGEEVVVGANFLIDAESNLRAALQTFTSDKAKTASGATP